MVTTKIYKKIKEKYSSKKQWNFLKKILDEISPPIEEGENLNEKEELQLTLNWDLATKNVCLLSENNHSFEEGSTDLSKFISRLKIVNSQNAISFIDNEVFKDEDKLKKFKDKLKKQREYAEVPKELEFKIDL